MIGNRKSCVLLLMGLCLSMSVIARAQTTDQPSPQSLDEFPLKVFRLKHIDCTKAGEVMNELFPGNRIRLSTDQRLNAIIVSAESELLLNTIEQLLLNLDEPEDPNVAAHSVRSKGSQFLFTERRPKKISQSISTLYLLAGRRRVVEFDQDIQKFTVRQAGIVDLSTEGTKQATFSTSTTSSGTTLVDATTKANEIITIEIFVFSAPEMRARYQKLQEQIRDNVANMQHSPAGSNTDELTSMLAQAFALQQEMQLGELDELEAQIDQVRSTILAREKIAEAIIDRKKNELLTGEPASNSGGGKLPGNLGGLADLSFPQEPNERPVGPSTSSPAEGTPWTNPLLMPSNAMASGSSANDYVQKLLKLEETIENLDARVKKANDTRTQGASEELKGMLAKANRQKEVLESEVRTILALLENDLEQAESAMIGAKEDYDTLENLAQKGGISESMVKQSQRQVVERHFEVRRKQLLLDHFRNAFNQASSAPDSKNVGP